MTSNREAWEVVGTTATAFFRHLGRAVAAACVRRTTGAAAPVSVAGPLVRLARSGHPWAEAVFAAVLNGLTPVHNEDESGRHVYSWDRYRFLNRASVAPDVFREAGLLFGLKYARLTAAWESFALAYGRLAPESRALLLSSPGYWGRPR